MLRAKEIVKNVLNEVKTYGNLKTVQELRSVEMFDYLYKNGYINFKEDESGIKRLYFVTDEGEKLYNSLSQ
ncbi:hypothetical protein [Macrococcus animalis]|uniref:hypothetical protein n=1 Tax=Macrococcus animalis TaxID=3395467 RepID=UPI0039BF4F73